MSDIYISIEGAEPATDGSELVILHAKAFRVDGDIWKQLLHLDLNIPSEYMQQALDFATTAQKITALKYIIEHYGLSSRVPYSDWPSSPTSWNFAELLAYDEAMEVAQAEFDTLNNQSTLQYARFIEFITITLGFEFSEGSTNQVKFKL